MAENTGKPVLLEYDAERPLYRLLFGFLEALVFVGYQHGYTSKLPLPRPCSGGWTEGLEFLAYLGALAIFIEMVLWIAWRLVHRREILSFEEKQRLFGKATRPSIANRDEVPQLFPRLFSTKQASAPVSSGPKDYDLFESGGKLPLVPRNPVLAGAFGLGLAVSVLLFHSSGSVDSCEPTTFSWPDLLGRLVLAYAFLAFGSIAEFRIVRDTSPSSGNLPHA